MIVWYSHTITLYWDKEPDYRKHMLEDYIHLYNVEGHRILMYNDRNMNICCLVCEIELKEAQETLRGQRQVFYLELIDVDTGHLFVNSHWYDP